MGAEIQIGLMKCCHCGEFGQQAAHIQHLGCRQDHEFGQHPAAVVKAVLCRVEIVEEIEEIPAPLLP